jgi:hypothetical protein
MAQNKTTLSRFERQIDRNIPKTVERQRYMTSVAAANPANGSNGHDAYPDRRRVIECQARYSVAGYVSIVSTRTSTRCSSKVGSWSLKAPFPLPCNHVAGVRLIKICTLAPSSECCPFQNVIYDTATDRSPIAALADHAAPSAMS